MNDHAIVCRIKNVRPHPNADRVKLGTACGFQVVIGLEVNEDDLGIYFPTDTCLGKDFAEANEELLTYFGKNLRVRTQKFRGELSEGFWCSTSTLSVPGFPLDVSEGDELSSYNDYEICKRYVNPATLKVRVQQNKQKKFRTGSLPTFQKHVDTDQLRYHWDNLQKSRFENKEEWIWTVKLHGTSQRTSNSLVTNDVDLFRKRLTKLNAIRQKKFGQIKYRFITSSLSYLANQLSRFINYCRYKIGISPYRYEYLIGTRNVILGEVRPDGSLGEDTFYSNEFRYKAAKPFIGNLHKGEVVYYEIVGYEAFNKPIMPKVEVKDKEIREQYGKTVTYSYGCANGNFDIYVYRITYQTEEGVVIDLTWEQLKHRCNELGVKYVPEFDILNVNPKYNCLYKNHPRCNLSIQEHIEIKDPIDSNHPMEGVVLRVDSSKPKFYKEKSYTFKVLEGIALDNNQVDTEDTN